MDNLIKVIPCYHNCEERPCKGCLIKAFKAQSSLLDRLYDIHEEIYNRLKKPSSRKALLEIEEKYSFKDYIDARY